MRLLALSLATIFVCATAHAQELPQAEIGADPAGIATSDVEEGSAVAGDSSGDAPALPEYLEVHSSGYSRFEIGDDGQIVVVYSGGVEFRYLGYLLRANELHFDQSARTADVSGDVHFESEDFVLSTQQVRIDGMAGTGEVSGHIVGNLKDSGVRFEADGAQLTFPPESDEVRPEDMQLVLSGAVTVATTQGAMLRTDQVALDGATRRFSSAPFTLAIPLPGKAGQPASQVQVQGTAIGGTLTEDGAPRELDILGLLAVSPLGRLSAEKAVAHPLDATGKSWQVGIVGSPVRLEYSAPLMFALSKKQPRSNVGPVLLESRSAALQLDSDGLKSATLAGGVTVLASGVQLGNRLTLGSVSMDRRAGGMALSAGEVSLGLDLARMLGIEPVDLSDLIK